MAFLWRLNREIVFATGTATSVTDWPATLRMRIGLAPSDFFGVFENSSELTTMSSTAEIQINGITGQLKLISSPLLPAANLIQSFEGGSLTIHGNEVVLESQVSSLIHFQNTINWISDRLTSFLAVHTGIFHEVTSLDGTLAGQEFSAMYPTESYSVAFAQVTEDERTAAIRLALAGPNQDQGSYARYLAACHYFQQAVRLISPRQVRFSPYTVHAEVLLNLCKTIEALVSPTSRADLRKKFTSLGFSEKEIESQIVPITLIRNEVDVGHAALNPAVRSEIATLRSFVDRSIQNVAAILRSIGTRIAQGDNLLLPVVEKTFDERLRFVNKLKSYLAEPQLNSGKQQPQIIAG